MVGLAVLVVVFLYVCIALVAIIWVKGWKKKLITLAIFILIPTADVIAGRIYFAYLCNTQSGQFIYKMVEVTDEYILKPGEINKYKRGAGPGGFAIAKGGEINKEKLSELYDFPFVTRDKDFLIFFHIEKLFSSIKNGETHELLSEAITFTYNGGWVENLYQPSTLECNKNRPSVHSTLFDNTFVVKKIGKNLERI